MPLINLKTSLKEIKDISSLQIKLSKEIGRLTGKSEQYIMTIIEHDQKITFAGSSDPSCFIEIKSIGSLSPKEMSKSLCNFVQDEMNIDANRVYIEFNDIKGSNWGYNSSTFG